jgi:hypothetical protein
VLPKHLEQEHETGYATQQQQQGDHPEPHAEVREEEQPLGPRLSAQHVEQQTRAKQEGQWGGELPTEAPTYPPPTQSPRLLLQPQALLPTPQPYERPQHEGQQPAKNRIDHQVERGQWQ